MRHSPDRRLRIARWVATSDDEHAVSIEMRRTLQAEQVRDAAGCDAVRLAGRVVTVGISNVALPQQIRVVGAAQADEHARAAARQAVGRLAGVLQRFPDHLEQQPLLRVHLGRLARRDTEERRVELVDLIEKRPAAR